MSTFEKCGSCENQGKCFRLLDELRNVKSNLYVAMTQQVPEFIGEFSQKRTEIITEYDKIRLSAGCI